MEFSDWEPTEEREPSSAHKGETSTTPIYAAVGKALSEWENMESGLTRLFQLLCESPSFAAARAYGTLESSYAKAGMLRAATDVFFASRNAINSKEYKETKTLIAAYEKAQKFRNNIAHGIGIGFFLKNREHSGYFLCPPSYATKKVAKIDPREVYLLGAKYWYTAKDVLYYASRFTAMMAETMRIVQEVNGKHRVLAPGQLHP